MKDYTDYFPGGIQTEISESTIAVFKQRTRSKAGYAGNIDTNLSTLLAHLSRRLRGELIVYQSSYRLCVCLCVSVCVCL